MAIKAIKSAYHWFVKQHRVKKYNLHIRYDRINSNQVHTHYQLSEKIMAQKVAQINVSEELATESCQYFSSLLHKLEPCSNQGVVLDVGCGLGLYGLLVNQAWPQARYVGTEPWEAMVAWAKQVNPQGYYEQSLAQELPYDNQSVYLVLNSGVIQFINHYEQVIKEALRVSSRYFILGRVPTSKDPSYVAQQTVTTRQGENKSEMWVFNEQELAVLIEDTDAKIIEHQKIGMPYPVSGAQSLVNMSWFIIERKER